MNITWCMAMTLIYLSVCLIFGFEMFNVFCRLRVDDIYVEILVPSLVTLSETTFHLKL